MSPEELAAELAAGTLRPCYLLAGAEPLLREESLAAIRQAALGEEPADFDLDRMEGEDVESPRLVDALRTLPVLAPRRLVVVREPASRRRGGKDVGEALTEAARLAPDEPHAVLVVLASAVDRREGWVKAFEKHGARVECEAPRRGRALQAFVGEEARRQGVELGRGAAELLAERVGPQLLMLRQELAKAALLAGPDGRISREDVAVLASDVAEDSIWELTDAIGEGRTGAALALLARLLAGGAAPIMVLGALAGHFRKLARLRAGGGVSAPPFVRRKLESQAARYGAARLVRCLRELHQADEELKGQGGLPPDLALERLLLALDPGPGGPA